MDLSEALDVIGKKGNDDNSSSSRDEEEDGGATQLMVRTIRDAFYK